MIYFGPNGEHWPYFSSLKSDGATNFAAHFRHHILGHAFWEIAVTLLRHRAAASKMLDILADLAKYGRTHSSEVNINSNSLSADDALPQIIHSSSGIVHELLNMLNTGAADADRWRIGVKGLLTLNLFDLPSKEEDRLVKSSPVVAAHDPPVAGVRGAERRMSLTSGHY
jgi:hypothetical protein